MKEFEPFKTGNTFKLRHGNVWSTFLMSDQIFYTVEHSAMEQLRASMELPGLKNVTVTPDFHTGYGVPIGSTLVSETHIYPDVVGPDPACSVALSKIKGLDIDDKASIIAAISKRVGVGNASDGTRITAETFKHIIRGELRQKRTWVNNTTPLWQEQGKPEYKELIRLFDHFLTERMLSQLGTIGGGNHFLEIQTDSENFYLMSHFGSRGVGAKLAAYFDEAITEELKKWGVKVNKGDLLYIPADSFLGRVYYLFQIAMLEWATYNHVYTHAIVESVLDDLQDGVSIEFLGHVPHNFIEFRNGAYVGRKGATPAYEFDNIPLLIPGSMSTASYVLRPGAEAHKLGESVAHGSGRVLTRGEAKRTSAQEAANTAFTNAGVLGNFTDVPLDECQDAYKDVDAVIQSLVDCGAAVVERRLTPAIVLKG